MKASRSTRSSTLAEGQRRRDAALAMLAVGRQRVIRLGQRALLMQLLELGRGTIDDVRSVVEVPKGVNPKCLGAVPGALARAGIIRQVGFERTTRAEAHARPVSVWGLANRVKALQWLAAHPPLPEVTTAAQLPLPLSPSNETGDVRSVARSATPNA